MMHTGHRMLDFEKGDQLDKDDMPLEYSQHNDIADVYDAAERSSITSFTIPGTKVAPFHI